MRRISKHIENLNWIDCIGYKANIISNNTELKWWMINGIGFVGVIGISLLCWLDVSCCDRICLWILKLFLTHSTLYLVAFTFFRTSTWKTIVFFSLLIFFLLLLTVCCFCIVPPDILFVQLQCFFFLWFLFACQTWISQHFPGKMLNVIEVLDAQLKRHICD